MPTIRDLLNQQVTARAALLTQRQTITDELATIRANLADPVPADVQARIEQLRTDRTGLDGRIDAHTVQIGDLEAEQARDEAVNALSRELTPGNSTRLPGGDSNLRIGQEPRTYTRQTDPYGRQFLRDVGLQFIHGGLARESQDRLVRHMSEERFERANYLDGAAERQQLDERAVGTGAFAGLTVPQYLTDMAAPLARAVRPFADACNGHPLPPDGLTLNLSRITTGTDTGLQASENVAVTNQDIDDTLLTVNVQTNAGQQTMSRQSVERGTGTEDITVNDLIRAYATRLDSTLINQAATGLTNVATAITYTDASPTVPEAYGQVVASLAGVEAGMLDMASGDNLTVMHSRRWYWLQNGLSTSFPLMGQQGLIAQTIGTNFQETYGRGVRGILPAGSTVVVSNNVPTNLGAGTNQDEIYCADRQELHLWEDPAAPVFIRAEQPALATLGVLFVVYGYFAYTFTRYAHSQKVSGTGLVTPVFSGV